MQSVPQVASLAPSVVEDEDEQSMGIEEVMHEDPWGLANAIQEVEKMIKDKYQRNDDQAEYIWLEASPERAEQYCHQVQAAGRLQRIAIAFSSTSPVRTTFYATQMLRTIALRYRHFESWSPTGTHFHSID